MKILIIHTAFIGDIVLSTPLIKRIKELYPSSKITYVTTPVGASILRNNPNLSEIIEYDKRGIHSGIRGILALGKRLRYENFNLVLTPHRYLRSSVLSWLTRSIKRVGYENSSGSFLFTDKIEYDKSKHEVEKLLSFMGHIPPEPRKNYKIEIFTTQKEKDKIDKIWQKYNLDNKKIVIIAPGSRWFTKRWPLEYFNVIINRLILDDYKIILIGGEEEKKFHIEKLSNTIDLRGKTNLLELAEVIKRADIILTNDSAPIHIASAFENVHILAIFGPTVKEFGFFPWGLNSEVLEDNQLKCRPCKIHGGNRCHKGNFECMLDITPNIVYNRISKYFKR